MTRAGDLTRRATFLVEQAVSDGVDGAQTTLSPLRTVWASLTPLSMTERLQARSMTWQITHRLVVRYHATLASLQTPAGPVAAATIEDRSFRIAGPAVDPDGSKTWLVLLLEEGGLPWPQSGGLPAR